MRSIASPMGLLTCSSSSCLQLALTKGNIRLGLPCGVSENRKVEASVTTHPLFFTGCYLTLFDNYRMQEAQWYYLRVLA